MSEDFANHFLLLNINTPVSGMLRGVLENYITTRNKSSRNWLGIIKSESGGITKILKKTMRVAEYYTDFD